MSRGHRQILLVTGGCRSGKSRFAQEWAESTGSRRLFLATASVTDEEMAERIARHKAARGERWMTVEEPLDVPEVVRKRGKEMEVLLVDCITIWLSNLMLKGHNDEEIVARVRDLVDVIDEVPCSWAMVTNEVGWGVVPDHPLGRRFRDLTGSVNQRLARTADQVVLMVAGQPVMIKGG